MREIAVGQYWVVDGSQCGPGANGGREFFGCGVNPPNGHRGDLILKAADSGGIPGEALDDILMSLLLRGPSPPGPCGQMGTLIAGPRERDAGFPGWRTDRRFPCGRRWGRSETGAMAAHGEPARMVGPADESFQFTPAVPGQFAAGKAAFTMELGGRVRTPVRS